MSLSFFNLLIRWAILALGVTVATKLVPGISYDSVATLVVVVLLLSFFNAVIRPVLVFFALPFIIVTLGFGVFLINALLLWFVQYLVPGFHVNGFWSALGGSLVVSLTTMLVAFLMKGRSSRRGGSGSSMSKDKDVIDI